MKYKERLLYLTMKAKPIKPVREKKKIKETFSGGVEDFVWRCGKCKKRVYPDVYLKNLLCPHCGIWGFERHAKKGEWILTI